MNRLHDLRALGSLLLRNYRPRRHRYALDPGTAQVSIRRAGEQILIDGLRVVEVVDLGENMLCVQTSGATDYYIAADYYYAAVARA